MLLELLGKKGTKEILLALEKSPGKFTELLDLLQPQITRRTLARRLRELESLNLIKRKLPEEPPGILYVVTPSGKQKIKLIREFEK